MCNGRKDAIPNTHQTITASIVVQTSMPSIVLIAPGSKSTTTSTLVSSTLSRSSSSTSSRTSTATTLASTTAASATTSNTSTPTSDQVSAETSAAEPSSSTSAKTKVIAISVASVGGAAILVGLLLLFVCLRRRRHRLRDSDMLPFQADPGTPRFYAGFRGPMETKSTKSSNATWGKQAPRIPPRLDTSDPYMFARRSIKPDTIGLAISPERNVPMEVKRSSRLLPDKPILKLNTQQDVVMPGVGLKPSQANYQIYRQSTATQFEEDDNSEDTAVEDNYGRDSTERMVNNETWEPKTIKVIPPDSQQGYYITNPDNYKAGPIQTEYSHSPEYHVKPLALGRGVGSFSRPRPGPELNNYQLQVPMQSTSQNQSARPMTAGSSVYSSASNTPYTIGPSTGPLTGNPFPMPTISQSQYQTRTLKSYKQAGPYDRESNGSFTSFDSTDSSPDGQPRHTIMLDLSPVVESPASATGKSPVSYPKIAPQGRLSQQTIRMVPPPPQPDFASIFSSGGGRTQPANPVMNTNPIPAPKFDIPNQKPWQAAELAAARQRRLSAAQARSQTYPVPQIPDSEPQIQLNNLSTVTVNQGRPAPKLASPFQPKTLPQQPPPAHLPTNPQPNQRTNHQRKPSREYIAPSAHFNNPTPSNPAPVPSIYPDHKAPHHRHNPSQTPSLTSLQSTNSSLLAKRLGAEKAAQLSLQTRAADEDRRGAKWRVLDQAERERAKDPGWRPQLVGRVGAGRGAQDQSVGMGAAQQSAGLYAGYGSDSDLPRTPGWVPKLTPTRRGDELFLSVA